MNGVNKTKNIAVVDNSVSVLMLIKQMMSRLGYENVTCFSCPQEALKEINYDISRFDAVFTNLGMPDIDGMCVIRELGKMSYRGAVCIISDLENRVTELAAEIAKLQWIYLLGSIAKPITLEALGDILTKLHKIEDKIECQTSALSRDALMRCIINDQVLPYYQPKVNLISRRLKVWRCWRGLTMASGLLFIPVVLSLRRSNMTSSTLSPQRLPKKRHRIWKSCRRFSAKTLRSALTFPPSSWTT